jgi:molybdopterin/thiamine biosynthesis adenylyltransferase
MAYNPRYNRQELIEGWNQEQLSRSRVAIIGSGNTACSTASALAALGIGNIELYDSQKQGATKDSWLGWSSPQGGPRVKSIESKLLEMNPGLKVKGMSMNLTGPMISILGAPSILIDASNNPKSREAVRNYASAKNVPFFLIHAGESGGIISTQDNYDLSGASQNPLVSSILGGMLTEEIRKKLMPFPTDRKIVTRLDYSLSNDRRFGIDEPRGVYLPNLKGKKALMIGAGALGNFVGLGLALTGIENLDILDYDEVDTTNLNRQVLFYDAVGKEKATALAARLREISPNINVRGLVDRLGENSDTYFHENRPDIILDCVDSFAVRAYINYFAVKYEVPLVSGGTNPTSGQVSVYVPGKTACLDCKLGVDTALGKELTAAACRYAPDPSVIMTNQIVGGMMVGEAEKVLDHSLGDPVYRILKYDSQAPSRGGLIGIGDPCTCTRQDMQIWLGSVKGKYAATQVEVKK